MTLSAHLRDNAYLAARQLITSLKKNEIIEQQLESNLGFDSAEPIAETFSLSRNPFGKPLQLSFRILAAHGTI